MKSCCRLVALIVFGLLMVGGQTAVAQQDAPPPSQDDLSPRDRAALDRLRARPAWLFPATGCPADVIPARDVDSDYPAERCPGDLAGCAERCEADDGGACYALAVALESRETETQSDEPVFEALYLRACRFGLAIGCTNRAAGIVHRDAVTAAGDACAARTFAETCRRDDPWGCTMYGMLLKEGRGLPKDLGRATQMLQRSCRLDAAFESCAFAKDLLTEIEDAQAHQPEAPE